MALNHNHSASDSALPIFAIVVLLATAFIVISYLTLVTKCCSNWHQINPLRWISNLLPQQNEDPFIAFSPTRMWNQGLDESLIQEIPTFQFTKEQNGDQILQSVYGCVVCLTEFQEQDMLKILPNCSHAFHLDCIDIWLQSNSNCPLCRSSISANTHCAIPMDQIIAPTSSPQDSQLLSNMGSEEDFVVIELGGGENGGTVIERNDSRESLAHSSRSHSSRKMMVQLKPRKCHHVSIMGDECIDVRKKDEQFCIQPIRRSFSMDSANDRQVYLDVQAMVQENRHQNDEACASEGRSGRFRRSFFPFRYGWGSKNVVLPLENGV
ncbi:RING-H2 finger protein ATL16-like [Lotus japonicus]|uniref:RING-H2 finger protein ATL16-like n=1 Tax=Lotus japonicus TaxID=34305 RepID=UPI00258C056F|nr:RING-H2 finger protein ATL16-like [Lotus japonicus]